MENRSEFNLETNIKLWKLDLVKKNNLTKENIIELEDHLLDSIDDLKAKGLSEEESFIIAQKRMGKVDTICLEFDKVNVDFSFINQSIPYLKGALIYIAFIVFSKVLLLSSFFLSDQLNINNATFNNLSIVLLVAISGLFFLSIYFRKAFLNKLNKINVLIALISVSLIIKMLYASLPLGGISPLTGVENSYGMENYIKMETNFEAYKVFVGFALLTMSLIFFWKNKRQNKLKIKL